MKFRMVVPLIICGSWMVAGSPAPAQGEASAAATRVRLASTSGPTTSNPIPPVTVGAEPIGVAADASTDTVYVTNTGDGTVSVIDAATCNTSTQSRCVVATVTVGQRPQGVAVDPATNTIYVANGNSGTVSVINGATCDAASQQNCTAGSFSAGTNSFPIGVAVDPTTDTVYVGIYNLDTVAVFDGATCNASSQSNCTPASAPVGFGPYGLAVDSATNTLYVTDESSDAVSVIDGAVCDATKTSGCAATSPKIPVGTFPLGLSVDSATNTIYVANQNSGTVSVLDGATCDGTVQTGCASTPPTVKVGLEPGDVAVDALTNTVYVANRSIGSAGTVSVINGATCDAASQTGCATSPPVVAAGSDPFFLDVVPATAGAPDTVYVADEGDGTVSIFGQPSAPGAPMATSPSAASATVTWTAPSSDGGLDLNSYTVVPSPACGACTGLNADATNLTTTIAGLTNGTTYTFTVVAASDAGPSPSSAPSNSITPGGSSNNLVVNEVTDSTLICGNGVLTLPCAIRDANAAGSGVTIDFNIPGSGSCCSINLTAASLPALSADHTTIDGYTQPGAMANTNDLASGDNAVIKIHIDGAGGGKGINGLSVIGSHDTVEGLSFTNLLPAKGAGGYAVDLGAKPGGGSATDDVVQGDFLGVAPDGRTTGPDGVAGGVLVETDSQNDTIGGPSLAAANVISGGSTAGITLDRTSGNTVEGNYIGTNAAGTGAVPNGNGVMIEAGSGDVIGTTERGNVISGNTDWGIVSIPVLSASGAVIANTVAGSIEGNLIGVNAGDSSALPNRLAGVLLDDTSGSALSTNIVAGNGLSGNRGPGVKLIGKLSLSDLVENNDIGVTAGGATMPNQGDGVLAQQGARYDSIASNTIADNRGYGIDLGDSASDSVHVSISHNSMYGNAGIRLTGQKQLFCGGGSAYVANTSPNDDTPCPLILAATPQRIAGETCAGCTVEVYISAGPADDEGKTLLGSLVAGTCPAAPCKGFMAWSLPAGQYSQALTANHGEYITATATGPLWAVVTGSPAPPPETSSFSRNVPVGATLVVNTTADPSSCNTGSRYSLRCAIAQANLDLGDEIDFNIPPAGCTVTCVFRTATPLPEVSSPSIYIDGFSQPGAAPDTNGTLAEGDTAKVVIDLDGHGHRIADGLQVNGPYDSVEGMALTDFANSGVLVGPSPKAAFDIVAADFIGTANGTRAEPNQNGVEISGRAALDTVGGRTPEDPNVISGNSTYGILGSGLGGNTLRRNLIGTNATGEGALANGWDGVFLLGTRGDTIGGIRPNEGNVISGNFNNGVEAVDASQASIVGNVIGLDAGAGPNIRVGNGFAGVYLYLGSDNLVGDLPFGTGANVISGNGGDGVDAIAETGDLVTGNIIGDFQGNGVDGLLFADSGYLTGLRSTRGQVLPRRHRGTEEAQRKLGLAFNQNLHIALLGRQATTAPAEPEASVGDESPLFDAATVNLISGNGADGVLVGQSLSDSDLHVLISENAMSKNGSGNGIDLFGSRARCSVSSPGPNDGVPCPSITKGTTALVSGHTCSFCTVELFIASNEAKAAGYGEGKIYLGKTRAAAGGSWQIDVSKDRLASGEFVTATATREVPAALKAVGTNEFETSQFSANAKLTSVGGTVGPR